MGYRIAYRGSWRWPWTTETHIALSLESLGHEVVRLQEDRTSWAECERVALGCQVFLWQRTWQLDNPGGHKALANLRSAGIPSVSYHLDRYVGLDREAQLPDDPFWRTSLCVTADGGHEKEFVDLGVNHLWLPPAVYDGECRIGQPNPAKYPHKVVFVGSHPYPHTEWRPYRTELIERLEARYGDRFAVWPRKGQPIRGKDLSDLYRSATVVVGDSCLVPNPDGSPCTHYTSDRIPETIGRGGFLVHPWVEGVTDGTLYRDGEHLATWPLGDWDALTEVVDYYLAFPSRAQEIAKAGQEHVLAHHTYRHRMAEVLSVVEQQFGIPPMPDRPRPQSGTAAVVARREAAERRRAARESARVPRVAAPVRARQGRTNQDGLVHALHGPTRTKGLFAVVPEAVTDAVAIREVWGEDTYRITRQDVSGRVCLDIGANIGAFSVLAAKLGAKKVVAFEPCQANYDVLVANLERNGVTAKVDVRRQAVMGEAGHVRLSGSGGGVHVVKGRSGERVESVAIDDVLREAGEVGLVKDDTEGAELAQFAALDASLLAQVAAIRMEFHGPAQGEHLRWLDDDGKHVLRWSAMVAKLAEYGRLRIEGRPMGGGLLWWTRY